MNLRLVTVSVFVLSASFAFGLAPLHQQSHPAAKVKTKPMAPAKEPAPQDDGQQIFELNCSRCHAAPEGFSPRISGTVVRHMRVRANLSHEDEQKLLRFFNP